MCKDKDASVKKKLESNQFFTFLIFRRFTMFQQMFRKVSVPALAFLGLSLVGEAAMAEQGWLFQSNYGRAAGILSSSTLYPLNPGLWKTTPLRNETVDR
jgi:hypothetical protein